MSDQEDTDEVDLVDAFLMLFGPSEEEMLKASIHWETPAPVDWTQGGFALGEAQLNATTEPPDLDLAYDPPEGQRLAVGTHTLNVALAEGVPYVAEPKQVTLTVCKMPVKIVWNPPKPVVWAEGGFTPGDTQLNAVTEPPGGKIAYTHETAGPLPVGTHRITAHIAKDEPYEAEPVTVSLEVNKALATITWPTPKPVKWVPSGFVPGEEQFIAKTEPPNLHIVYSGHEDGGFEPGEHTLTATLDEANYQAEPKQVTLSVRKMPVKIVWNPPKPVVWAEGGFTPGDTQLNAVTEPPGGKIAYTHETAGPLPVGTHRITAHIAKDEPYEAEPVTVSLEVNKALATITWPTPKPVKWVPSGFVPGEEQFTAKTEPPDLHIVYSGHEDGGFEPGEHTLTATLDEATYQTEPKQVTLTVQKADPGLTWKKLGAVPYKPNLKVPDGLRNYVNNPNNVDFRLNPPVGTPLALGANIIEAIATDGVHYDQIPVRLTLTIKPGEATIKVEQDLEVPADENHSFVLDVTFLGAKTTPPGLALAYDPPAGTNLYKGYDTVTVSLDPSVILYEADPVWTKVNIAFPPKPQPGDDKEEDGGDGEVVISKGVLRREYPYGGKNVTPHIHQYGSSFHIKLAGGQRLNLVQNGHLYHDNLETVRGAVAGDPRLLAIVNAMVDGYE